MNPSQTEYQVKRTGTDMEIRRTVLLADANEDFRTMLRENIEPTDGFTVVGSVGDGREALRLIEENKPDLVLADVVLPGMDGFEVLTNLRKFSDIPVIILSARTDEQDNLRGLSLMADDYMTKPFSVSELIARIKVNLARAGVSSSHATEKVGDITVDFDKMTVIKNGDDIPVSKKEFEILSLLLKNRGKVLSRETILEKVWGYNGYLGDLRTVDVAIGRLRAKIETAPKEPEIILSRRGAGYYIV